VLPVVLTMLPALCSVVNAVPVPVTVVLDVVAVIVPERRVLGQAVASQVPMPALVIFRLTAPAGAVGKAANSIIAIRKAAAVLCRNVFVLILVFMVLLGCDRDWRIVYASNYESRKIELF
jgi:hypothetical protein